MSSYELVRADSLLYLKDHVPDDSIDLICTDPPYDSLEKHRKTGTTTRLKNSKSSSNVWFPTITPHVLLEHCVEWLRVLKPGRHLYIFCDPETSYDIVPALKEMGWRWGNRLIWDKINIGMGYHYRRRYEDILFFTKKPKGSMKKRRLKDLGMADVLPCKRLKGAGYYPTEKPVSLLRDIINQSVEPGETVLDPFMGSGSTGEATISLDCNFLGIDVGEESHRVSEDRMQLALKTRAAAAAVPAFPVERTAYLSQFAPADSTAKQPVSPPWMVQKPTM